MVTLEVTITKWRTSNCSAYYSKVSCY